MEYAVRNTENTPALQRLGKWLRLKQYQIEVTFAVYMFTPVEKFAFCMYHYCCLPIIFACAFEPDLVFLFAHFKDPRRSFATLSEVAVG